VQVLTLAISRIWFMGISEGLPIGFCAK